MTIKHLEWDSTFFNKKIGLLELKSDFQIFDIENDYDLIYVLSDKEISIDITNFRKSYSETKVIFSKSLVKEIRLVDKNVISVTNECPKNEIYDLAFESGKFSRFNLDMIFKKSEFKELYKKWVDNSYKKEFADNILVYKYQNNIIGFITYKIFENYGEVGLIATNPSYQGKGIGRKLLEIVESELVTLGVNELRISTQLQNEIAYKFYIKMGYKIIKKKIVKHYWRI